MSGEEEVSVMEQGRQGKTRGRPTEREGEPLNVDVGLSESRSFWRAILTTNSLMEAEKKRAPPSSLKRV